MESVSAGGEAASVKNVRNQSMGFNRCFMPIVCLCEDLQYIPRSYHQSPVTQRSSIRRNSFLLSLRCAANRTSPVYERVPVHVAVARSIRTAMLASLPSDHPIHKKLKHRGLVPVMVQGCRLHFAPRVRLIPPGQPPGSPKPMEAFQLLLSDIAATLPGPAMPGVHRCLPESVCLCRLNGIPETRATTEACAGQIVHAHLFRAICSSIDIN
jgi:hypothetical protein